MASPDLFPNVAFSDVSASASAAAAPANEGATAAFGVGAATGGPRLSLVKAGKPEVEPTVEIDLSDAQVQPRAVNLSECDSGGRGKRGREGSAVCVLPTGWVSFGLIGRGAGARCFFVRSAVSVTALGFAGV